MLKKLKDINIAVINTYNAKDVKIWSGIPYHISILLDSLFEKKVMYLSIPPMKRSIKSYIRGFYFNRVRKKRYYTWADEEYISYNKRVVKDFLGEQYDLIITFQFYLVPLLKERYNQVIHWNDATFANLVNYYSGYSNLSDLSCRGAHAIQKEALELSDIIIYSSDWAIDRAVSYYNCDRKKLRKILFASNFSTSLAETEVEELVKSRKTNVVKLLFLTPDWERKGGIDAIQVLDNLNNRGVKTLLYVVGTEVPDQYKHNENVIQVRYINKNSVEGEIELIQLFKECTFLITPSRIDITPVAFSEANSFALPVLTTDVGAIPSVIKNNINGCYFPLSEFVDNATEYIIENLPTSERYHNLCYSSYDYYNTHMSWKQVESKFLDILTDLSISQQ